MLSEEMNPEAVESQEVVVETPVVEQPTIVSEPETAAAPVAESVTAEAEQTSAVEESAPDAPELSPVLELAEDAPAVLSPADAEDDVPPVAETAAEELAAIDLSHEEHSDETHAEGAALTLNAEGFDEDALVAHIDEVLADESRQDAFTNAVTADHLILLVESFSQKDEIKAYIRKVGVIKRAFDTLKDRQQLAKPFIARFSGALGAFNKKRAAFLQQLEEEKKQNAERKRALINILKALVDNQDPTAIEAVRALQEQWKTIGHVPKEDMDMMYNEYRYLLDQFFKLREDHFKMLDYDRARNLKGKEALLADIEKLVPAEGEELPQEAWRERTTQMEQLQERWKEIGFVPKDDSERINSSYRTLVDRFFETRRAFNEVVTAELQENTDKKRALIERLQAFAGFEADKPKIWNDATVELQAIQEEWKLVGRALNEFNNDLWLQYRELCNKFFEKKQEFFKDLDESRISNMEKKQALIEKAEALSNSHDWNKAARELKTLQTDWQAIGPVPEKHSNKLWNRFRKACDAFFEARRAFYQSLHSEENSNLALKENLIEELKKIASDESISADDAIEAVKDIQTRWKDIGKVPFKQKDSIWDKFRKELDTFFDAVGSRRRDTRVATRMKEVNFEEIPNQDERVRKVRERMDKVRKKMDIIREKLESYSNNILYISKGKSGDVLRTQIQKEIDAENRNLATLREELKQLQELLKAPAKPAEVTPVGPSVADIEEKAEALGDINYTGEDMAAEDNALPANDTELQDQN